MGIGSMDFHCMRTGGSALLSPGRSPSLQTWRPRARRPTRRRARDSRSTGPGPPVAAAWAHWQRWSRRRVVARPGAAIVTARAAGGTVTQTRTGRPRRAGRPHRGDPVRGAGPPAAPAARYQAAGKLEGPPTRPIWTKARDAARPRRRPGPGSESVAPPAAGPGPPTPLRSLGAAAASA